MMKVWDVFWRFLVLGCYSFGGPAAHLGYFRKTFVQKLKWLSDADYAQLIAMSQLLPGPGSSQVGFALGLKRAGLAGGLAAFIGFTLPSFVLLYCLTQLPMQDTFWLESLIHGLKLLAVVVVADATYGMFLNFCKQKTTAVIAVLSAIAILMLPSLWTQIAVVLSAAIIGTVLLRSTPSTHTERSHSWLISKGQSFALIVFALLFIALPLLTYQFDINELSIFNDFYQAGSLVFGGGHVVLPLLQQILSNNIDTDTFLQGYAAAQAVPGPMFTMATFLGANLHEQSFIGASIATLAVFLPGFLLVYGLYRTWEHAAKHPYLLAASTGINAAVVGLLLAALYQPVFISAIFNAQDLCLVLLGLLLLRAFKVHILWLVLGFALSSIGLAYTL